MTETDDFTVAKLIRLRDGDDLVSELVELGDENILQYMLINPMRIVYMTSDEYAQVALVPWVIPSLADTQEFVLNVNDVLIVTNVSKKLNEYYWNFVENLANNKSYTELTEETKSDEIESPEEHNEDSKAEVLMEMLKNMANKRTYH